MPNYYILNPEGEPAPCDNVHDWCQWYEENVQTTCMLKTTYVNEVTFVSTIFLALNHNFLDIGSPILWETMAFKNGEYLYQERYLSKSEALADHDRIVQQLRNNETLTYLEDDSNDSE